MRHQEILWIRMIGQSHPETNPITIKPKTASYRAELFSWVPLPTALHQVPFPNKISCFVSTCVSLDNSVPSVRQEPSFGPWKGFPLPATLLHTQLTPHSWQRCGSLRDLMQNMTGLFIQNHQNKMMHCVSLILNRCQAYSLFPSLQQLKCFRALLFFSARGDEDRSGQSLNLMSFHTALLI